MPTPATSATGRGARGWPGRRQTQRCGPRTIAIPSPTPAAFKLTVKQTELNQLLAGSTTHILAWGGSRSGKSFTRARAIVIRAMRVAGSRHLIARYRFNHVVQSIWHDTLPKVVATCSAPRMWWWPDKASWFWQGLDVGLAALPAERLRLTTLERKRRN